MPFKPTSPPTRDIKVVQPVPEDTYQIHELHIYIDPNDPIQTNAEIIWSKGHQVISPARYNAGNKFWNEAAGAAFLAKMMEPVPAGLTYYEAVKRGFWEFLQGQGAVPDGTVE